MFIYCNLKFNVTCNNEGFDCRYIRTEEKASKTFKHYIRHFTFSHTNILTKLPSSVFLNLLLLMKPPDALQNASF